MARVDPGCTCSGSAAIVLVATQPRTTLVAVDGSWCIRRSAIIIASWRWLSGASLKKLVVTCGNGAAAGTEHSDGNERGSRQYFRFYNYSGIL